MGEFFIALGKPFLNWAGKAERLSFDVPTLPLFIHERLSTKAIIETLVGHKRDKQESFFDLFGDPQHSISDQVLRAYEHRDKWVNRMILGDSLVVMNSLLEYEGLGGQVQMIYIDPPYEGTTGYGDGLNVVEYVKRQNARCYVSEGKALSQEAVCVSTGRSKGGISGNRKKANEEWLSHFPGTSA